MFLGLVVHKLVNVDQLALSTDEHINSKVIARLDSNNNWHKAGELLTPRRSHAVINPVGTENAFLVVGGHNYDDNEAMYTEKCVLEGQSIKCSNQSPLLKNYQYYPHLFPVQENYCKEMK